MLGGLFLRAIAIAIVIVVAMFGAIAPAYAQEVGPVDANNVIPPRLKADSPAPYPDGALKDGVRENVVVNLVLEIGVTGEVRNAVVDARVGHGFDEAAILAAKKLVFDPATRGGSPITAKIRFSYTFAPPPGRLVGRIARQATDSPVANAHVVVRDSKGVSHEANTAADGTFRVDSLPFGPTHVSVDAPRLQPATDDEDIAPGEETSLVLRLTPVPEAILAPPTEGDGGAPEEPVQEVRIQGERPPREVTKHSLSRQEMTVSPGTNGDALKSLQNLPGVARPPPFSGQLIVRGSAPQDTQYFVDGTAVPIVYHFGGLSSVLPTEALEKLDFYPGNFGAQFGRGMGGIVDINLRNPLDDGKFHTMVQLDSIDVRFLVERSLGKGWSFMAGGRRSYFDAWIKLLGIPGFSEAPRYYDYQLMVRKEFSPTSDLRVAVFGSDDRLDINGAGSAGGNFALGGAINAAIAFWRAQIRYENKISSDTRVTAVAAIGQDIIHFGFGEDYADISALPISGRAEVSQRITRFLTANVGIDILDTPYEVTVRFPRPEQPGTPAGGIGAPPLIAKNDASVYTPGAYTELEVVPIAGTRIVPGIRADYTNITKEWNYSPRITVRQDLVRQSGRRTTLKGGIGYFYQPPTPFDLDPVFGQKGLISNRAAHLSAGIEQEIGSHAELSVEPFYKKLDHLVVTDNGNRGDGRVVGTETLLRWKNDPTLFGWVAYTISRSERRDDPSQVLRLFQYDQTHILTILASKSWGKGFRLGGRFRFVSGALYTPDAYNGVLDIDRNSYQPVGTLPLYNARLDAFHQLDIRFDKTVVFKPFEKFQAYIDMQNIYNHRSEEGVAYNYNYTSSQPVHGLTILSIIGIRGDF